MKKVNIMQTYVSAVRLMGMGLKLRICKSTDRTQTIRGFSAIQPKEQVWPMYRLKMQMLPDVATPAGW